MKQQEKNHLANFLIILTFFILVLLFGISLNFIVNVNNGGRMPVYSHSGVYETNTHFPYLNKNEVNLWYLSDIYLVENKYLMFGSYPERSIFSIGDFFIDIGYFGIVFSFAALLSYGVGFYFKKLSRLKRGKK